MITLYIKRIYDINLLASNFEYFWALLFILLHYIWSRHNKNRNLL